MKLNDLASLMSISKDELIELLKQNDMIELKLVEKRFNKIIEKCSIEIIEK